ncbi:MAG TPA: TlpA disulfide reductase family protein [Gemmatimonadales bacterium]|nr:TlpA disulfide reductase family protein [Gemmatimonadales bacterium]
MVLNQWGRCALVLAACSVVGGGSTTLAAQQVGTAATAITVTSLEGTPVTLDAKAANRPMLLEFWATWCEVCEALMPTMRKAHAAYGTRVDFIGVNVTVNDPKRRVAAWVARQKPPYRVMYDDRGTAVRAFQAPATSYVVIIGSDGVVRYTGIGAEQELSAELAKVVAQ